MLSVVALAYNPMYWGGRDQEDHGLRPAPISTKKLDMVVHTYHSSYVEGSGSSLAQTKKTKQPPQKKQTRDPTQE
jgi:hypothetical protein